MVVFDSICHTFFGHLEAKSHPKSAVLLCRKFSQNFLKRICLIPAIFFWFLSDTTTFFSLNYLLSHKSLQNFLRFLNLSEKWTSFIMGGVGCLLRFYCWIPLWQILRYVTKYNYTLKRFQNFINIFLKFSGICNKFFTIFSKNSAKLLFLIYYKISLKFSKNVSESSDFIF